MLNQTVLMSGTEYFRVEELNPYSDSSVQPEAQTAQAEHTAIREALARAGVKVITIEPPKGCQDGVYTANWALCRGDIAVLSCLPNLRQAEEPYAEQTLQNLGKKVIKAPYSFSGQGDALPCGNLLFCGSQYRTEPQMHQFLADTLGYEVIGLQTVPLLDANGAPVINKITGWPDSFFYDIDLALAVLKPSVKCNHGAQALSSGTISSREADQAVSKYGDGSIAGKNRARAKEADRVGGSAGKQVSCPECRGLIAWCPEAFTLESQEKIRAVNIDKIEVSLDEAKNHFACNLVSTGHIVVMSAEAPKLKRAIEEKGLRTVTPTVKELAKGGGYIRCTTLTLDNN